MAREFEDIQKEMLDAKDAAAEFNSFEVLTDEELAVIDLDSESKVSIWRNWIWIVAYGIWTLYQYFDIFKAEITVIVENNRPHGLKWYKNKTLAFQYGHPLINDDEYAEIDIEAQKVKQAAVEEEDRTVIIKVATLDGDDLVKIDDTDVIDALIEYLNAVKDAGTRITLVNKDADELKADIKIYYDPLIMKSDGSLTSDSGIFPVFNPAFSRNSNGEWDAMQTYLRSLDFNGKYLENKQIDLIQLAEGVKDVKVNYLGFKAGLSPTFMQFERMYKPLSGYMKLADDEITVEYIPYV